MIAPASAMERSTAAVTARPERGVGPTTVLQPVPRVGYSAEPPLGGIPPPRWLMISRMSAVAALTRSAMSPIAAMTVCHCIVGPSCV